MPDALGITTIINQMKAKAEEKSRKRQHVRNQSENLNENVLMGFLNSEQDIKPEDIIRDSKKFCNTQRKNNLFNPQVIEEEIDKRREGTNLSMIDNLVYFRSESLSP